MDAELAVQRVEARAAIDFDANTRVTGHGARRLHFGARDIAFAGRLRTHVSAGHGIHRGIAADFAFQGVKREVALGLAVGADSCVH